MPNRPGGELYDPASDEAFRAALKQDLGKKVRLLEVDADCSKSMRLSTTKHSPAY